MSHKKLVALVYGGISGEADISCTSAKNLDIGLRESYDLAYFWIRPDGIWCDAGALSSEERFDPQALKSYFRGLRGDITFMPHGEVRTASGAVKIDFFFNIVHGIGGEDGALQGFFETLGVPYNGADVFASALAMDKVASKVMAKSLGVPVVPWMSAERGQRAPQVESYPVFVKPSIGGSSCGISFAQSAGELKKALEQAFAVSQDVLIEQAIVHAREIEVPYFKGQCYWPGEVTVNYSSAPFYSYEAKYLDPDAASESQKARIPEEVAQKIMGYARLVVKALDIDDMARVDFFLDEKSEREEPKIYFNEINTLPGFTAISLYPQILSQSGLSLADICRKFIEEPKKRL